MKNIKISQSEEVIHHYGKVFNFFLKIKKSVQYDSYNDYINSNPRFIIISEEVDLALKVSTLQDVCSSNKFGKILLDLEFNNFFAKCNKFCYGIFNYITDFTK